MDSEHGEILARLETLRAADAPTHGGRVLSYVYDSGRPDLDELAAAASRAMQPVNGLDPTTFTSVAVLEREVVEFARALLGGDVAPSGTSAEVVVGSVTSGGTESCLLSVKTARDRWVADGGSGRPRLLAPVTVHAAFQKAAHLFGLELDLVPVDSKTGVLDPSRLIERIGPDVALVVVSAPSYPFAGLDPIEEVASACLERGTACHVDACIGGWILPFWSDASGDPLPPWDLRVPGVTSISADLHKYGYAPKGVSVLLQRGRDRQRAQYFATTRWPGYPVVNPTLLGSKSAGALAAAWAILNALGPDGFATLAASCARSTARLVATVESIPGLGVVGDPVGPLIAVKADLEAAAHEQVDPHRWADQARRHGWILQLQPGLEQSDGTRLPHTTHLTITPVTESHLDDLCAVLIRSADEVRGRGGVGVAELLSGLDPQAALALEGSALELPDADASFALLRGVGLVGDPTDARLPAEMAPFLALVEALPHPLTERLLTELLARVVEPAAIAED